MNTPMIVTDGTIDGQLATLGRYILTIAGSFALGRGWIDGEALQAITGILTVAAPMAYGIWKTHVSKRQLINVASAAPDVVARVV